MKPITLLEDGELKSFLAEIEYVQEKSVVYRIRFHQEPDGKVKYKINERMWSPAVGVSD